VSKSEGPALFLRVDLLHYSLLIILGISTVILLS
jgi:hypothetical protein